MSDDARTLPGRRKLLVLGAGAAAIPACSSQNGYPTFGVSLPGEDGGSGSSGTSSSGGSASGGSSGGSSGGPASSASSGGNGASGGGGDDGGNDAASSGGDDGGGSSSSSSSGGSSAGGSSSGGPACSTAGKILTLSFSQYPKLMNTGGSAVVTASGYSDPNCGKSQIIVVCKTAGQYVALSTSCTHQCCAVSFVSVSSGFRCPCHGANFDINGKNKSSIAPFPLPSLSVCSDSAGVYVTLA
ncbi:MAG: ubiquinol-cytochrome c reductase iron-sulfur subunit [Polyangiaceae bacterium]